MLKCYLAIGNPTACMASMTTTAHFDYYKDKLFFLWLQTFPLIITHYKVTVLGQDSSAVNVSCRFFLSKVFNIQQLLIQDTKATSEHLFWRNAEYVGGMGEERTAFPTPIKMMSPDCGNGRPGTGQYWFNS